MSEYVPGAPNVGVHIPKKYVADETVVDKRFHHASLVGEDEELASIEQLHQIMPYVWLASWDIATDMTMLKEKNIKFVLSLSPTRKDRPTLESMAKLGIVHEHYPVENVPDWKPEETGDGKDGKDVKDVKDVKDGKARRVVASETGTTAIVEAPVQILSLVQALPMASGFIKRAFEAKKNILVHDDQGTSAAPAAVAYFLLRTFYDKAAPAANKLQLVLNKIKIKRPCVDINFGFLERLEDFEAQWSGRAVVDSQSLSIRRNPVLKAKETARIRAVTAQEKQQADTDWNKQVKVDGARGARKKLL
jgi:hypothetical protein